MKAPHILEHQAAIAAALDSNPLTEIPFGELMFEEPAPFYPPAKVENKVTLVEEGPVKMTSSKNEDGSYSIHAIMDMETDQAKPLSGDAHASWWQQSPPMPLPHDDLTYMPHGTHGPAHPSKPVQMAGDPMPWTDEERHGPLEALKQGIFDRVLIGMRKQRVKSVMPNSLGTATCVFRSPNGARCAVGMLIPDRHYECELEGGAAHMVASACGLPPTTEIIEFLDDVRIDLHDRLPRRGFMESFEMSAREFARMHNLEYRWPGQRVAKLPPMRVFMEDDPVSVADEELEVIQF